VFGMLKRSSGQLQLPSRKSRSEVSSLTRKISKSILPYTSKDDLSRNAKKADAIFCRSHISR